MNLIQILEGSKLSWIITQVQEQIIRGRVSIKPVKDVKASNLFPSEVVSEFKTSKDKVSIFEAYNYNEQLQILICAMKEFLNILEIKKQLFTNLKTINQRTESIEFIDENDERLIATLNLELIDEEQDDFAHLYSLLEQIKKEM